MKVAEIFADLGFKVQGAEELKAFETTLQNIAAAARNAALALKVLARTSVPKELTQIKQTAREASGSITGVAKKGQQQPPVVLFDAYGRPISPAVVTAPTPAPAQPAPSGHGPSVPNIPPGVYGQNVLHGPSVPNIPPGVYGQNVLHGPPPPSSIPPVLAPKQPNNGMSTAVMQGFKALGALGLKVFGITTIALALKKLVRALTEMVAASMKAAFAVDKLTFQTGLSRREFKEWEHIAALSDVTSDELQDQLKRLQTLSRQIRYTGEGVTPFMQLGINSQSSPTDIMKQFAQRTQHMDAATAVYWGSLIGLSENMVYMIRKQGDKLKTLSPGSELGDNEYKQVTQLNAAWKDLSYTLSLLKDKITSDLAPGLTKIFDVITDFLKVLTVSKDARTWTMGQLTSSSEFNPQSFLLPLKLLWAVAHNKGGGTTNVENNVSVKVDGAGKPGETAKATAKSVEKAIASPALYGSQAAQVGQNW